MGDFTLFFFEKYLGKSSVAIAVAYDLQSRGLPVNFLSVRGLWSKAELTSKLLSLVEQPDSSDESSPSYLSGDEQVFQQFTELSDRCVLILDNADDLLGSGFLGMNLGVILLLEMFLRGNRNVTLVTTTRKPVGLRCFRSLDSQVAVRIEPLDKTSSLNLVRGLLPDANIFDCMQIMEVWPNTPSAIKALCSCISDEGAELNQILREDLERGREKMPDFFSWGNTNFSLA